MKKYSKIVALIVFMLSSANFALQAQTFRIEAGYSQPRIYSNEIGHRFFHGFHVGGTVEFDPLPQVGFLTFQTGLLYSHLTGNNSQRFHFASTSDSIRINTQGHQLNIPLYAIASYTIVRAIRVSAFAGPNFNIGLAMPQRVETTIRDNTPQGEQGLQILESLGYRLGTSDLYDGRLRRFNLQMDVGASAQWWKLQVKGGYSFGLNNISQLDFHRQRQSGWFVSLAYEL
jgi:hypothetical protein